MSSRLLFSKNIRNGGGWQTVTLSEEEEAKVRALHDVEAIRILRACTQDAQFLSENPERSFQIALALFDKRCDKVDAWMQKALEEKARQARKQTEEVKNERR